MGVRARVPSRPPRAKGLRARDATTSVPRLAEGALHAGTFTRGVDGHQRRGVAVARAVEHQDGSARCILPAALADLAKGAFGSVSTTAVARAAAAASTPALTAAAKQQLPEPPSARHVASAPREPWARPGTTLPAAHDGVGRGLGPVAPAAGGTAGTLRGRDANKPAAPFSGACDKALGCGGADEGRGVSAAGADGAVAAASVARALQPGEGKAAAMARVAEEARVREVDSIIAPAVGAVRHTPRKARLHGGGAGGCFEGCDEKRQKKQA
jgi:hypothetical protein